MSFDERIIAFAERFLSERTFRFIVVPAVADLQFEDTATLSRRMANRLAVLRAVAGAVRGDLAHASAGMLLLGLLPAGYYIFLLVMCFDVFSLSLSGDFALVAGLLLFLSFAPVMVCFWPEPRQRARPID
jgi:hypothetical protein